MAWSFSLYAEPFTITERTSDLPAGNAVLEALNKSADNLAATVNNGFLSSASRENFNASVAKAATSPGNSLWVDRASSPDRFVFGAGLEARIFMDAPSLSGINFETDNQLPPVGGVATAGIQIGLPPTFLGFSRKTSERLFGYFSGIYFASKIASIELRFVQVGLNGQYRLVQPKRAIVAGWGGIVLASGINFSSSFIGMNSNLQLTSTQDVSGQTVAVNVNMDYQLGVRTSVITIPFEVSTNVSLLYALTLFSGAGADLNFGSASLSGSASGPVTATYSGSFEGSNLFSGIGSLNLDDGVKSSPTPVVGRFFGGLQFNLWLLKASVQYTYLTNASHGLGVSLRTAL